MVLKWLAKHSSNTDVGAQWTIGTKFDVMDEIRFVKIASKWDSEDYPKLKRSYFPYAPVSDNSMNTVSK